MGGPTANTTDVTSENVHGTNPQRIVEKILRTKVYATQYWKESCFGLTAETLVDRAIELSHVGGTYGGTRKPTKFMCLLLKMLQIQPDLEIVVEFVTNEDYKYVRALGALYLRCVGRPAALNRKLGEDHYLVEAEVTVSKVSLDLRLNAVPRLENRRQDDVS